MNLILKLKNQNEATIQLKKGRAVIDQVNLTIGQDFDTLLIVAIDNLLIKNKIERLSLKSLEIRGKLRPRSASGMILKTIKKALKI